MIYLLAFVVIVLAVARATRVLWFDEICQPLRSWVLRKWPLPSKPGKLVTCYWCLGFWVSLLFCAGAHTYVTVTGLAPGHTWLLLPLTTSAVAYASAWVLDKEGIVDGV